MSHESWKCVLAVGLVLVGSACQRQPQEAPPPPAPLQAPPPVQYDIPDEPYATPQALAQPRLQFVWRVPGEDERSVFSIGLDGKDLQRVVRPDVLRKAGLHNLTDEPVRSPDRRYLAGVAYDAQEKQLRFLVDLKTRTVRTMMADTYGAAHFNWTPDSRHVFFYGSLMFWQYDVRTGKRIELPTIYSQGLYLLDGGKRFLAVQETYLAHYDRRGKLLKKTPLPFRITNPHALSPDGSLLMYTSGQDAELLTVVRTERPEEEVFRARVKTSHEVFGPGGRTLYFFWRGDLISLDTTTGKTTVLEDFTRFFPSDLTLLSARGDSQ